MYGRGNNRRNNRGPPRERFGGGGMSNQNRDNGGVGNMNGPLMTEHLNLRALDLELALLKQKRELIEQQQEMLSQSHYGGSQNNYLNQPDAYQSQPSSVQGFSQYYEESRPRDHGTKRRAIPVWENAPEPKRFGSDNPNHSRRHDTFTPTQNRGYGTTRRGNPKPPPLLARPSGPRFNPSRVTKPQRRPAPLQTIRSAPVSERRDLVSKASTDTEDVVLYEDETKTSSKVIGRLELALGVILKEVKDLYGNDTQPPLSHLALKAIKSEIRARMRKVMLGKEVTTTTAIVDDYRKVYPKKTNNSILNIGLDNMKGPPAQLRNIHKLAIQIIDKGRPDIYYRNNFSNLLSAKLDEMFADLRKLYKPDKRDVLTIMKEILAQEDMQLLLKDIEKTTQDLKKDKEAKEQSEAENKADEKSDDKETKSDDKETKTDDKETKTDDKETKTDETVVELDKENTTDKEENVTEESITEESKADEEKPVDNDVSVIDVTPEEKVIDLDEIADEPEKMDVSEQIDEKEDSIAANENSVDDNVKEPTTSGSGSVDPKDIFIEQSKAFRFKYYDKLIDNLLTSKLPAVLRRYKKVIMDEILTANEDYKNTLAYILVETKKKEERREKAMEREKVVRKPTEPRKTGTLHFVKIFGKPSLPKRPVMQAFLDKFNPSTIKKHRTFNSLLFVGFADKTDFDNILAANKTVLGKCTLDIRPSENKDEKRKVNKKEVGDKKEEIDSDMDKQIEDLLQSIRNEEDGVVGDTGKEDEKKDGKQIPEANDKESSKVEEINLDDDQDEFKVIDEVTDSDNGDNETKTNGDNETANDANSAENDENPAEKEGDSAENVENPADEKDEKTAPKRQSARIATSTPTIKTRRASKLNP